MITVKATIKSKPNSKGLHSIILSFVKNRKNSSYSIMQYCKSDDWSYDTNRVKNTRKDCKAINLLIDKYLQKAESLIIQKRILGEDYEISELLQDMFIIENKNIVIDYFSFHQEIIDEFKLAGKVGSVKINKETLKSLQSFSKKTELKFKDINLEFISKYESYLRNRGGTDGGIGIKMRTIRAIINKAISRNIINDKYYAFKKYKISKLKSENKKEYLTKDEIFCLENADVSYSKRLQFAKDMYLFSFYSRGMNFLDLIQLTKYNISKSHLSYQRSKTGVHLSFELFHMAEKIIRKYDCGDHTDYLFPVLLVKKLDSTQINTRSHKVLGRINPDLKIIMQKLSINKNITFYTARHSFATLMKFAGNSIDAIGEALGHSDINSTISYLNKLPSKRLDRIVNDIF